MNLSIASRVTEFAKIISDTVVTYEKTNRVPIELERAIEDLYDNLSNIIRSGKSLYIVGNGGSAAVAAHAVTDFFNVAKIRAFSLHESSLLTCMANDFGYENAMSRMLEQLLNPGDMVIAISSSGNSKNMQNATKISRGLGAFTVTLSGFSQSNALRSMGDVNIWLDSIDYGFVEIGHQFILHNLADRFNEKLIASR